MDNTRLECDLCGGRDFYKEAGSYFCKECQTQTQEIQEHNFDDALVHSGTRTKKVGTEKKKKEDSAEIVTSWECYNYILLGLVNELIELGASKKLKSAVKFLWFRYLEKLEVINKSSMAPPKLPAYNIKLDAEAVYGRKKKRKRKRSTSGSSSSDESQKALSSALSSGRSLNSARRKQLVTLSQEDSGQMKQSQDQLSLANQSLATLKSSTDDFKNVNKYLHFNKYSKKELLKNISKTHLRNHRKDINDDLECHHLVARSLSSRFTHSVKIISRIKVYALLYLGLLMCRDRVQLGDMLRFIRERHLSFHNVKHFLPEDSGLRFNVTSFTSACLNLTHNGVRKTAAELAKLLGVDSNYYLPTQDLNGLCERYCKELNLPEEIGSYAVKLMALSKPSMQVTKKLSFMPNYEGRTMGFIIFSLKLLFGLDDATENEFSKYADLVNSKSQQQKMFVFNDWKEHIGYRKVVLEQVHFPTQFLNNKCIKDPILYYDFLKGFDNDEEKKLFPKYKNFKQLLEELDANSAYPTSLKFSPSLTPFCDYIVYLLTSNVANEKKYMRHILDRHFEKDSVDFLIKPNNFLILINDEKVGVKHHGANTNLEFTKPIHSKTEKEGKLKRYREKVQIKLILDEAQSDGDKEKEKDGEEGKGLDTTRLVKMFNKLNSSGYQSNMARNSKVSQGVYLQTDILEASLFDSNAESYNVHYNPYERYWLLTADVLNMNHEEFLTFFKQLPKNFQRVVRECARILEQSERELFAEFADVELYMSYVCKYGRECNSKTVFDSNLRKLIRKSKSAW